MQCLAIARRNQLVPLTAPTRASSLSIKTPNAFQFDVQTTMLPTQLLDLFRTQHIRLRFTDTRTRTPRCRVPTLQKTSDLVLLRDYLLKGINICSIRVRVSLPEALMVRRRGKTVNINVHSFVVARTTGSGGTRARARALSSRKRGTGSAIHFRGERCDGCRSWRRWLVRKSM